MLKKTASVTLWLLIILVAGLLMLARPWADYPPWRLATLFTPSQRVQNFQYMEHLFASRTIAAPAVKVPLAVGVTQTLPTSFVFEQ